MRRQAPYFQKWVNWLSMFAVVLTLAASFCYQSDVVLGRRGLTKNDLTLAAHVNTWDNRLVFSIFSDR